MATLDDKILGRNLLREAAADDSDRRGGATGAGGGAGSDDDSDSEVGGRGWDDGRRRGGGGRAREVGEDDFAPDAVAAVRAGVEAEAREEEARLRRSDDPLRERTAGRRTGVKGVLADAHWHDRLSRIDQERDALKAAAALRRAAYGATAPGATAAPASSAASSSRARGARRHGGSDDDDSAGEDGDDRAGVSDGERGSHPAFASGATVSGSGGGAAADVADDDGDDFLAAYRSQRRRDLASAAAVAAAAAALPRFGEVVYPPSREAMVDEVDATPRTSFALVFLHADYLPESVHLAALWPRVAAAVPHVRLMMMAADDASESIDVVGLPAIIIYRGGETVEACVAVHAELGRGPWSVGTVIAWLRSHGVGPLPPAADS